MLSVDQEDSAHDCLLSDYLEKFGAFFEQKRNPRKVELIHLSQAQIKKRKEVNYRQFSRGQQARFDEAMQKERSNACNPHIAKLLAGAEARKIRSDPSKSHRIVKMRWVLTEKDMRQENQPPLRRGWCCKVMVIRI